MRSDAITDFKMHGYSDDIPAQTFKLDRGLGDFGTVCGEAFRVGFNKSPITVFSIFNVGFQSVNKMYNQTVLLKRTKRSTCEVKVAYKHTLDIGSNTLDTMIYVLKAMCSNGKT